MTDEAQFPKEKHLDPIDKSQIYPIIFSKLKKKEMKIQKKLLKIKIKLKLFLLVIYRHNICRRKFNKTFSQVHVEKRENRKALKILTIQKNPIQYKQSL